MKIVSLFENTLKMQVKYNIITILMCLKAEGGTNA